MVGTRVGIDRLNYSAGVVDQHIQPAELALGGLHHCSNAVQGGQVRGDEACAQPFRGLLTRGGVHIDDHHRGAFGDQPAGHRPSDPGGTTGHDRTPAPQYSRLIRSSVCHATVLRRHTDIARTLRRRSKQSMRPL